MFSDIWHAVYFNESNTIEFFIIEVKMSSVFFVLGSINFLLQQFLVGISHIVFGDVRVELGGI